MAISLVGTPVVGGGAGGFTTGTMDTTGADFIVAVVASSGASAVVSDNKSNGNMTGLTKQNTGGGAIQIFYYANPTVGSGHTFTLATAANMSVEVLAFSGVATSSPFDGQQNGTFSGGTTTQQPGSITPAEANALIVTGASIVQNATTLTIDSGFSAVTQENYSPGTFYGSGAAYLVQTSAVAVNPTWTGSVAASVGSTTIAAFKPGVAGAAFLAAPPLVVPQAVKRAGYF